MKNCQAWTQHSLISNLFNQTLLAFGYGSWAIDPSIKLTGGSYGKPEKKLRTGNLGHVLSEAGGSPSDLVCNLGSGIVMEGNWSLVSAQVTI